PAARSDQRAPSRTCTWNPRTSTAAAQIIRPPSSKRRRRPCLWTRRFTARPPPARPRPPAARSRSPLRAAHACPTARPRPARRGSGSRASASAARGRRAPPPSPRARSAPLPVRAALPARDSAAIPRDSTTQGGRRTPAPRSGFRTGPASGRLPPRPQAGAPRTWVRRHLLWRSKHRLPRQRLSQRPPPALAHGQLRRTDAPAAPLPERLFHTPVFERVVGEHHENAVRRQLLAQDRQRPLKLLQLLVH